MNKNLTAKVTKSLLLGGSALGLMVAGASADELSDLRAQLDQIKSRVQQLEASPAPALPAGASFITLRRGSDIGWDPAEYALPGDASPADRGFTFAITPSADLPAPVMEVTVSGYVKADIIYDTYADCGDSCINGAIGGVGNRPHVRLHAKQSRFRIRSRSDTAIGQIRTLIEGDFEGGGDNQLVSNSSHFRLRHAWGEWDMTPNWTLGLGQFWGNNMMLFSFPPTLDFSSPEGATFTRQAQVRLTYKNGPMLFAVSAENPETDIIVGNQFAGVLATGTTCRESLGANACGAADPAPDLVARWVWSSGGMTFGASGTVRFLRIDQSGTVFSNNDTAVGAGVNVAASIPLGSMLTVKGFAQWGDGLGRYSLSGGVGRAAVVTGTLANPDLETVETFDAYLVVIAALQPTLDLYATAGFSDIDDGDIGQLSGAAGAGNRDEFVSFNVGIQWKPVSKFRLGLEAQYREHDHNGANIKPHDNVRIQAGGWFFF